MSESVKGGDRARDVDLHMRLMDSISRGDEAAFEEFYRIFSQPVYNLAYKITGDSNEAEEILQDAFVSVWKSAKRYDPRLSKPFSWLIVITRRLCWNRLRGKGRHTRKIDALKEAIHADVNPKPSKLPDQATEGLEMKEKVEARIEHLPKAQRACMEMALFSGLTHQEIASELQLPLGTVKTWLRRGLLKIKSEIEV